jgi:hypothetical protein
MPPAGAPACRMQGLRAAYGPLSGRPRDRLWSPIPTYGVTYHLWGLLGTLLPRYLRYFIGPRQGSFPTTGLCLCLAPAPPVLSRWLVVGNNSRK